MKELWGPPPGKKTTGMGKLTFLGGKKAFREGFVHSIIG